jgi:2-polyprenyl-3-methyl-5-hydroxy-6-metoxy-1,4-benzoquinol methylase
MGAYEPSSADVLLALLLVKTVLRPYYARYVRSLGLKGHERVLDFGSGPGVAARHIAARLAEGGGRLTCVDVSQTWMRIAQKATRRYPNIEYKLGRIAALDVENAAYDVVLVHFVLHDIPAHERLDTVHHLAGKLRQGGRLVVREPTAAGHGISPEALCRLLTGAGLQQIYVKTGRAALIQAICDGVFHKAK